jgi:hypothetical protein
MRQNQYRKIAGWFNPARRKFITQALTYIATLTTIIANLQKIFDGRSTAPVAPIKISSSDRIAVNVVVTPRAATASFGTVGPVVLIS